MRNEYNEQLKILHGEMVEMGTMCQDAITLAIEALTQNEEKYIKKVLEIDSSIDKKERDIEALCLKLLLKQQPVASDLRDVSSALKMISDMERIGDQASDIAEMVKYITGHGNGKEEDLQSMAWEAIKMVKDSIHSFVTHDLELARSVIAYDEVVDGLFSKVKGDLIAMIGEDNSLGEYYLDLLMVAKYLERIADHATNIAEWVEYSITGKRSKDGVIS